jgi:hypothetical protein
MTDKSKSLNWIAKIDSSMIKQAAYNPEHSTLFLEFSNGTIYKYDDVPFCVFEEFSVAPSQGKYFHAEIKGQYEGSKLEAKNENR